MGAALKNPCCSSNCPAPCGKEAPGFPSKDAGLQGYSAPGLAMAEALTEGSKAAGKTMLSPHGEEIVMSASTPSRSSKLDGLWRDKEHAHMIQDMMLTWSDNTVAQLKAEGTDGSVSVVFNDAKISGRSNGACTVLKWSDDDRWSRITLNGVWDDLGHFHIINDTTLFWSNGQETSLALSGWSGATMDFKNTHVQGTLERSGDRIVWSDGDVWLRAGVDGYWQELAKESGGGTPSKISQIVGSTMIHSGGKRLALVRVGRCSLSMTVDGKQYQAHIDELGRRLVWSDGEVWKRLQTKPKALESNGQH